jgi:NADH dehydrogenase
MEEVEHRVVIVGGGAGGAELAAALGRQSQKLKMKVSLVDCASQHLWKPRLHEVAAGVLGDSGDAIPYLALGQANGFRFYLGGLVGLDVGAKTIAINFRLLGVEFGRSAGRYPSSPICHFTSCTAPR